MDRLDILYAVGSALAIYATFHIVVALSFPDLYCRHLAFERDLRPINFMFVPTWIKWRYRAQCAVTIFATSYLIYRCSAPLVEWIPFDWGSHDEDGDWSSARETVRGFLTLAGAGWLLISGEAAAARAFREKK